MSERGEQQSWFAEAQRTLDGWRALADPLPDLPPTTGPPQTWHAADGEVELARIDRLADEALRAGRHVDYVRNYGRVRERVEFRCPADGTGRLPQLRLSPQTALARKARVDPTGRWVELALRSQAPAPAEFTVVDGSGLATAGGWTALGASGAWELCSAVAVTDGGSAYESREPVVTVPVGTVPFEPVGPLLQLTHPMLGRPVIDCGPDGPPRLTVGESREEALAAPSEAEAAVELVRRADGRWTTAQQVGCRYLAVEGVAPGGVIFEAQAHRVPRRGGFACSDPVLTRIWHASAYTLRACMHELLVDGIKRDRAPWCGDLAVAAPAIGFAFGDRQIAAATLRALGRPTGHVNGIVDYSLWWVVAQGSVLGFLGAGPQPATDAERVDEFLRSLAREAGADALLRPRLDTEMFQAPVFIDWGVDADPRRDVTALQVLWFWALRSGSEVLSAARHPGAGRWSALADRVASAISERRPAGAWPTYLDDPRSTPSPHAAALAVLSGLDRVGGAAQLSLVERLPGRGTPFTSAFALSALGRLGRRGEAVARLRELWGAMLDRGALTFWEDFATVGADPLAMYGRPYGKSLCHAWSSGPAWLLPELILGVRPTAPGWSRFTVDPMPGGPEWAVASVPAPSGDIRIESDGGVTRVEVPAGCVLESGGRIVAGPDLMTI